MNLGTDSAFFLKDWLEVLQFLGTKWEVLMNKRNCAWPQTDFRLRHPL